MNNLIQIKNKTASTLFFIIAVNFFLFTTNCFGQDISSEHSKGKNELTEQSKKTSYNPDWTIDTHGKSSCNYDVVFPQSSVNKIVISMTSSQWDSINSDIYNIMGVKFGNHSMHGRPTKENPNYVDVLIEFNGKVWKNVGFRLKGNSSLMHSWGQGNYKLPFRLDFDKFEDVYPEIKNQRFYGFKKLSFSPAFQDQSLIREKLTSDIFRLCGIESSKTAFCQVYINFGKGVKYCGIYTVVELVDDNMIKDQFNEGDGNIYKPESNFSSFNAHQFDKKNNKKKYDYSDIVDFITKLNSPLRTIDEKKWQEQLEKTFDIEHFIKYLAINNTIVNWDSYGTIAHNYYLYNHSKRKLTWIPWDHNEALKGSPGIKGEKHVRPPFNPEMMAKDSILKKFPPDSMKNGFPPPFGKINGEGPPPGFGHGGLSLSMNEVSDEWPLIKYIVDNKKYFQMYRKYLRWFVTNDDLQKEIKHLIVKYHKMISPYVISEAGEKKGYSYLQSDSLFIQSEQELKKHLLNRKELVEEYLKIKDSN